MCEPSRLRGAYHLTARGMAARCAKEGGFGDLWGEDRLDVVFSTEAETRVASDPASRCPVRDDFDPFSAEYQADPAAVLALLPHDQGPVFHAPSLDYYVVTGHAEIEQVFLDNVTYSAANAQLPLVPLVAEAQKILLEGGHQPQPSMVSLDEPAHRRLRNPAVRAFTPRRVAAMELRIRAMVTELLDAVDTSHAFDLVSSLTFPLPATMIFSFMGVPRKDWPILKEWCGHRADLGWGRPTPDQQVQHAESMAAYRNYLRRLVADRIDDSSDGFTTALLTIHDENPEALTLEEIASILFSLSFAGHETTNNLIANAVRRLLEERARWSRLVAQPELIPVAIEEVLRFDPSVPVWRRVTTRPTTLGGVELPAGAKLYLWLAAAGRDRRAFDHPEEFEIERTNVTKHLAFGKGIHYCLGAALGKLETQIALEELARRFPNLRLVPDQELTFHPNISFRGPQALWVTAD